MSLSIRLEEDWSSLLYSDSWSWTNFRFITLELEDERFLGGVEIRFALLGLCLTLRWDYTETELMKELAETVDDIRSGRLQASELPALPPPAPETPPGAPRRAAETTAAATPPAPHPADARRRAPCNSCEGTGYLPKLSFRGHSGKVLCSSCMGVGET